MQVGLFFGGSRISQHYCIWGLKVFPPFSLVRHSIRRKASYKQDFQPKQSALYSSSAGQLLEDTLHFSRLPTTLKGVYHNNPELQASSLPTNMADHLVDETKLKIRPEVAKLFEHIESTFFKAKLGDRWYLITLAALVGGTEPMLADQLYLYIINKPAYQQPVERQALVRRLREALVKLVSIVGVCKPLESIIAIMKVEREEDRDYSFSRKDWQCDQQNHQRGMDWLRRIYAQNTESTLDLFQAHQDFRWISTEITYGLYLSDRQNLDDLDTELVVLVGIMIQNLKLETHWHIRGTRRIGVEQSDVKIIIECVRKVAEFMDVKLDKIPTVEEVEDDV